MKNRHTREEEMRMLPSTGPLIFYKSSKLIFQIYFHNRRCQLFFISVKMFMSLGDLLRIFSEGQENTKPTTTKSVQSTGLHYVLLLCMALSSARSFLKDGLFLGSYCQQLLIILEISTGQLCGAGIRYPETHHRQSNR